MPSVRELCQHLETVAPIELAEDWDNVGLLIGDPERAVDRVMTCLTMTPETVLEAASREVDLVVTHHPLPFRPVKRMTTDTTTGRLLWQLAAAGISVYSPHTAWDSARRGINQQLADGLRLTDVRPLQPIQDAPLDVGSGRYGRWPEPLRLAQAIERIKQFLSVSQLQYVGSLDDHIQHVAVACGSAGAFLSAAHTAGCQLLLTGETSFHTCLEAKALGLALVLPGHYASERFALDTLADRLRADFPGLEVWASTRECDPLNWS